MTDEKCIEGTDTGTSGVSTVIPRRYVLRAGGAGLGGLAVGGALPIQAASAAPRKRPQGAKTRFYSSLEKDEPQPDWTNEAIKASGVTDGSSDGASGMESLVGKGPKNAYAAKTEVGFTGLKALRYSGKHTAKGRGYSYNKVFDVQIWVTSTTELSYVIFPEFTNKDLDYPSTYAAVDLLFDDGSYLSDLGATDQNFTSLSPQAQGKSNVLYPDQWNWKLSHIGKVAAGKIVEKILVAYDNPKGSGDFQGWIDCIRVTGRRAESEARKHLSDYAVTTRGTHSSGDFSRGNNIPAAAVPHGFNFWVPATDAGSLTWLYEYHKDNNDENLPELEAFSVSHEPSPWMGDRQTFQVMPASGDGTPNGDRKKRAQAFTHENEIARPHYYSVRFEDGTRTEIAPTDHAALFRFTFSGDTSALIFDNVSNDGGLTIHPSRRVVTGYSDTGSDLSAGATRLFVYAIFDKPVTDSGTPSGTDRSDVAGYVRFDTSGHRVVQMRIATSLISVAQAKRNLTREIASSDSFDQVRARAQHLWDEKLSVVEVEGASEDQLVTLYSNLYRLSLYPNSGHENTGTEHKPHYQYASPFSSATGKNTPTHTGAKIVDGTVYVNNGFWDTYRPSWPAYSLLYPKQAGKLIDGFVQQYKDGGWVARWSSPGYADLMVGTSSDVAFADAYVKGVRGFDVQAAYEAAVKNATVAPPRASVGRKGLNTSIFLGYTPTSTDEGMSWALGGCINDFGIANMSKKLYESSHPGDPRRKEYEANYEYFLNRAQNYVHMFDPEVEFFQGKDADGKWRRSAKDYDPRIWGYDYTETNGWNMAFTVPHDGQGLANLYGGRAKLAKKLDTFFNTPETGRFPGSYDGTIHEMREARDVRMGQWAFNNQPAAHTPYMYNYVGQPWKAQEKVREALARLYSGSQIGQGYPGDEDNGQMSAWYVFSSLGFYPLQVGSAYYVVGSPLFTKATVHLENDRDLVVKAPRNSPRNVYVQGLKVNGKRHQQTYLPHDVLAEGAVLEFEMGPTRSRWGTGDSAAPPSLTTGHDVPEPLHDVIEPDAGKLSGSADTDVTDLVDNTSDSRVTFDESSLSLTYEPPGKNRDVVTHYTLTSGKDPDGVAAWTLHGSQNGRDWKTLDHRAGESFPWSLHTRAFKIRKPKRYRHYRLTIERDEKHSSASLAEIELLGRQGRGPRQG